MCLPLAFATIHKRRRESFIIMQGRGGGQVVSVLAFYSNNPNSNPADVYSFIWKICVLKDRK